MSAALNVQDPLIAEMIAAGLLSAPDADLVAEEMDDAELAEAMELTDTDADADADPVVVLESADLEADAAADAELSQALEALEEVVEPIAAAETDTQADAEPEASEELDLERLEQALAAQAAREEVYAEQESTVGIVTVEPAASAPRKAAKPAGTGTAPKREVRFAGSGAAGAYVASVIGDAEVEALVDVLPKKVKEKAANLVDFIHKGRTLSVFTRVAVDILKSEGKLTNERLVKAFTTEASKRGLGGGYTIGTARSQAGQQIALFGRMNLAHSVGGALVPNPDSKLWQAISA
jgi:hypothetical protein